MDLSDGLADAVRQIAAASHVGITLDADALPIADEVRRWHEDTARDPAAMALQGGDDYELLFTARPSHAGRLRDVTAHAGSLPITKIGEVTRDRRLTVTDGGRRYAAARGVRALPLMRLVISRSVWRKLMVTFVAIVGFVLAVRSQHVRLARDEAPQGIVDPTRPAAGARQLFTATAYCKGTTTASGVGVRTGIAASDPALLPVGSVVNVTTGNTKYNGVYTIMDTGPKVQGRLLDLYMWSCHEALAFGRQQIELTVLRLGWNPSASTPSLVDRLFRRREAAAKTLPPPPPLAGATGVRYRVAGR